MDRDGVEVHKLAKKERGQYPAILTSHLVNNPYIITNETISFNDTGAAVNTTNSSPSLNKDSKKAGIEIILHTAAKRISESTRDGTCCWTKERESQLTAWKESWACFVYHLGRLLHGVGHGNLDICGGNY